MLEIAGIATFLLGLLYLGWRFMAAVQGPWEFIGVGICASTGYLLADFVSGIVHWAGDTVGDETTPVLGPHFVTPFRQHHVDPKAITRHDFIETNGNNCIVSLPILGVVATVLPRETGTAFYLCATVAFLAFWVFCTNQFHKWAHADDPPRIARFLQRWCLILSPDHHDIHHAAPHDKYYCITVGWMNPILTWVRFFRLLERMLGAVRPTWLHISERGQPPDAAR
jgi:hypothetical protein